MDFISLHKQCIVVVGLVGANLRAEKPGLHIVRQQLFHGLAVFLVSAVTQAAVWNNDLISSIIFL